MLTKIEADNLLDFGRLPMLAKLQTDFWKINQCLSGHICKWVTGKDQIGQFASNYNYELTTCR